MPNMIQSGLPWSEIISIIGIILLNSIFVISEIALLMSKKAKLNKLSKRKFKKGAMLASKLLQDPNLLLSSVQVGITLMSILLGMHGGVSLGEYIIDLLPKTGWINEIITPYNHVIGMTISVIIITYLTVLSEIVPKRIAMLYPEVISSCTSHVMKAFILLAYPLVWFLTKSTKKILHLLQIKELQNNVSVDEIRFVINQAESAGNIKKTGKNMLYRLANISNMSINAIMIPRKQVISLDIKDEEKENLKKLHYYPFRYFPLIEGDLNNIKGIITTKNLWRKNIKNINNKFLIDECKNLKVYYIPEVAKVENLIDFFIEKRTKIAVVVDEYGDTEGIVTFNDFIKAFSGDINMMMEGHKPNIEKLSEGCYLVDGSVQIDEIEELLQGNFLQNAEMYEHRSIANFALGQFDSLPKIDDSFIIDRWQFQVMKIDKFRIEKIKITTLDAIYNEEGEKI